MSDYGLKPWEMDLLTDAELKAILKHQNDRWDAIKKQNDQMRQQPSRGRRR